MYDFDVQIIKIADDFFEAYKRCIKPQNIHRDDYGRTVGYAVNVPAIVNASFACELYFKNMINEKTKNHNLKFLYDKLDEKIQEELETKISQEITKLNYETEINCKKDFVKYLDDISDTFVFWRYIHEKNKPTGFLGKRINECCQLFDIILPILKELSNRNATNN
ncbi:MAG: hypothetical protein HFE33_02240 [Clostridia bacterium]|jgi:hypothetical protein|nr:hypothetical protein [Clostridia bacterium]MCI8944481.1 hypothetical protein [Clostridia bacterium]MCI9290484.1 hypothetical protein [Clostridia bacterium]